LHWQFTSPAHVKGLAVEVSEAIRAGTRATVWVTPVVVVWGDFTQGVGGNKITFVQGALSRSGSSTNRRRSPQAVWNRLLRQLAAP
jgi:hypothetical protein